MLRPSDHFLWDFWFAPRGREQDGAYHLFYLQAPRSLPDPELRHARASVGHAVSPDLVHWEERGTALAAGPPGSWDDRAIWTGSIIERAGIYYCFYTGTAHAENGLIQRIGMATSTDLISWERHPPNPVIEADDRWYEKLDLACWYEEACRDPWVVYDAEAAYYYMFYTARVHSGPAGGRGVIGCARSPNLTDWEPLPPVSAPGEFGHLEVPQLVRINSRYYMLFCTARSNHSAVRRARTGPNGSWTGTHYLVAETLTGPYHLLTDEGLVADDAGTYYAGRLVEDPSGQLVLLAWRQWDETGRFAGDLSDPAPVRCLADGRLEVDTRRLRPAGQM
jgi:beta-fructofuranosidase